MIRKVAVIVAHPDDETLWAGGLLLMHPEWSPVIVALCRRDDPDRAPRFFRAVEQLGAHGVMGDLDDGPGQQPQAQAAVMATILALLPGGEYDLVLTHAPEGEYTRHLRHEETSLAVETLWRSGAIKARELWTFAFEDRGGAHLPRARRDASLFVTLPDPVWEAKRNLLTRTYGFSATDWETRTTPRAEAFQRLEPSRPAVQHQP